MDAKRIDEYHKHGCHFHGKLVVVDYSEDMQEDPKWGTFAAGLSIEYYAKAKALVKERQYNVVRELLSVPELVMEIQ